MNGRRFSDQLANTLPSAATAQFRISTASMNNYETSLVFGNIFTSDNDGRQPRLPRDLGDGRRPYGYRVRARTGAKCRASCPSLSAPATAAHADHGLRG